MPLGGKDEPEVLAALDRHKKFLRGEIAQEVNLKFAPEMRFRIDDTFDNVSRIDALLNSDTCAARSRAATMATTTQEKMAPPE